MTDVDDRALPPEERILDAAIALQARDGVAGVSMRAVARRAGVATGLANFHVDNTTELISAALEQIGERDLTIVTAPDDGDPDAALRASLRNALRTRERRQSPLGARDYGVARPPDFERLDRTTALTVGREELGPLLGP